jgi:hypothetical protein
MIASLDERPISSSGALMLLVIGSGEVALRASASEYTVEAGEFHEGAFRPITEIAARMENGMLRFHVDPVQSKLLLLISRRASIAAARHRMTEALR